MLRLSVASLASSVALAPLVLSAVLAVAQAQTTDRTETVVQWSAKVYNLSYAALSPTQAKDLATSLAAEVADALGIQSDDIWDATGQAGLVTLGNAAATKEIRLATTTTVATTTSSSLDTTTLGTSKVVATTTTTGHQVTTNKAKSELPPLSPLRGIAYGALPCTEHACGGAGLPSEDMLQSGYAEQWGPAGRDDLGTMARLGANAVRLYHSLGLEADADHGAFLDHSEDLGLNVMVGYHTENANNPSECPGFDCFSTWKEATLLGFEHGFKREAGWHPAVGALILLNEPDFFESAPKCMPSGSWCRVKAALSALDGVLAAEKEAGIDAGRVKLTVTWSFAMRDSIDGKVNGPGVFGFQDIVAGIADPALANYVPRSSQAELEAAFQTRWIHGLNTQSPWSFVDEMISKVYDQFSPIPWFIGEYGGNGQDKATIQADLMSMQQRASNSEDFLGAAFFQFQTTYWKGGAEMNFGLFSLGTDQLGETGEVCDKLSSCRKWPVHCLSTELTWLSGTVAQRAQAVADAWGGSVDLLATGFCGGAAPKQPADNNPTTSTMVPVTTKTTVAPTLDENGLPALQPLRGVAYGALPCTEHDCGGKGRPSEDMLQDGYAEQWGPSGRDDLATMAAMGANAVRLYHSMGMEPRDSHSGFLDRAQSVGLNVLAGYHTEAANEPSECPGYDCFDTWKNATLKGFELGFQKEDAWHPAVATLILLNEPDFFEHAPKCQPSGAWCRVKAALSAMDGVLAAENEAGVKAGRVKLTVTWSFAMTTSIDGKVNGPGIFGFQDMVAGIADPSIAHYTPRTPQADMEDAFKSRWVHGLNTQAPWSFVDEMVTKEYANFAPLPWFIGEYGGNGQEKAVIQSDLEAMQKRASESDDFLGAAFFQFQTTYWKGGEEMNFGLFGLGREQLGETGELCDKMSPCRKWPVRCLTTNLSWLPGSKAERAEAAAAAWGGQVPHDGRGFCGNAHRLLSGADSAVVEGTAVSCQIRRAAVQSESRMQQTLDSEAFAERLTKQVGKQLGDDAAAIRGKLAVQDVAVVLVPSTRPEPARGKARNSDQAQLQDLSWWMWILLGIGAGLLAFGCVVAVWFSLPSPKGHPGGGSQAQVAQLADSDPAV